MFLMRMAKVARLMERGSGLRWREARRIIFSEHLCWDPHCIRTRDFSRAATRDFGALSGMQLGGSLSREVIQVKRCSTRLDWLVPWQARHWPMRICRHRSRRLEEHLREWEVITRGGLQATC